MRTASTTLLLATCLWLTAPGRGSAQAAPVTIQGSELHQFRTTQGAVYQIYVALPEGYEGSAETLFPVLYLTDASQFFAMVTQTYGVLRLGQEVPAMILVGVERLTPDTPWLVGRTLDLTPTVSPEGVEAIAQAYGRDVPSGGADAFLSVVVDEVIPWVEARYRTSETRALAGYSLGGLFALHALFESTGSFADYIIGSPSLWWDNRMMLERETTYSGNNDDLHARVFLSVGTEEGSAMLQDVKRLAETLADRGYAGLELEQHLLDGETHLSGIPASFSRGMRFLFRQE